MDSQTIVGIVVGALFLAGLIGALIPWIPGPLFILIGALVWAIATHFAVIGVGRLVILVALALTTLLVNFAAGPIGARRSGGSRWAVAGAIVGALAGLFFGPFGLLLGPVVGAVAGEMLRGGDVEGSLRSGVGALIGTVAGIAADFVISVAMIGLFLWWIWRV
jgi:uncharacterized protein YqgC (DUF456 family)